MAPLSAHAVRSPARYVLLATDMTDRRVAAFAAWLKEECERFSADRGLVMERLRAG